MCFINMSGKELMGCAAEMPQVRYSTAYPTGREFGDEPYHIYRIARG